MIEGFKIFNRQGFHGIKKSMDLKDITGINILKDLIKPRKIQRIRNVP